MKKNEWRKKISNEELRYFENCLLEYDDGTSEIEYDGEVYLAYTIIDIEDNEYEVLVSFYIPTLSFRHYFKDDERWLMVYETSPRSSLTESGDEIRSCTFDDMVSTCYYEAWESYKEML